MMKGPRDTNRSSSPPPPYPGLNSEIRDHFKGDGLRVKMSSNASNLWIQGDGCRVSLTTNRGLLRVSGDGCRVHIAQNLGSVEYHGDGGRVILGSESVNGQEWVKYRGSGGVIEFGDVSKSGEKKKGISKRVNVDGSATTADLKQKLVNGSRSVCAVDICIKSKC